MTKRDRIMLSVVATVAVVAGFYMVVLKPLRADLAELDEQRAQATQRRDAAQASLNAANAARAAYKRDSATLAVLGKAVPSDDGVPSLLYQVEGAAQKAGVRFSSVKVAEGTTAAAAAPAPAGATAGNAAAGAAKPGASSGPAPVPGVSAGPEGLQTLPLSISFEGSFFRLERFLSEVHRFAKLDGERVDINGRLLTIEGISLKPGTAGLPTLKAEITARAYVAPASSSAQSGSATTASTTTPAPATGAAATAPGATR